VGRKRCLSFSWPPGLKRPVTRGDWGQPPSKDAAPVGTEATLPRLVRDSSQVPRPVPSSAPPVVLTVAGSDNSCGAGAQADLKTIHALGGYAQTAITCCVAEVPGRVEAIRALPPDFVAAQIRLSVAAFPVRAVKTGMLHSRAIIAAVAEALAPIAAGPDGGRGRPVARRTRAVPIVVDPVMVASSGAPLLEPAAVRAYADRLFPLATIVTPNLDELRILSGLPCRDLAGMEEAGTLLVERHGCAWLLKGGHLRGRTATDILATPQGRERFEAPFRRGVDAHGTGCTFSAAIATGLAQGLTLRAAVAAAKGFITAAVHGSLRWGRTRALHHGAGASGGPRG
jgi:hydroxymethylpyrimidine/phosphomethylpyrimidine kinase